MLKMSTIQAAARQIAEQFKPQKIILFGSYAYGTPNEDSDVDLMVLIKGRNAPDRSLDIRLAIDFDFPIDLLVRSPVVFEKRITMGDLFLIEIQTKGKVLYEAADKRIRRKSGRRLSNRAARDTRKKIPQLR